MLGVLSIDGPFLITDLEQFVPPNNVMRTQDSIHNIFLFISYLYFIYIQRPKSGL